MLPRRDFLKQSGILLTGMILPMQSLKKYEIKNQEEISRFDVIIIGGSYAGLAAGLALGRALRTVLIIDSGNACNKQTPHSHNFLTHDGKPPAEIARLAHDQVRMYPTVEFLDGFVSDVAIFERGFHVTTAAGDRISTGKIILATGIHDILPEMSGFRECWGISVLHCPYCHGYEFRQQKTGIIANGDAGFELSTLISNWTNDLVLYTNGSSLLTPLQQEKLQQHKIGVVEEEIEKLEHDGGFVRNIVFRNGSKTAVNALYIRPPFTQHAFVTNSLGCEVTDEGYVKTDAAYRTTAKGVYACGDNASRMRTVANAVASGTATGMMVNKELIAEEFLI